MCGEPTPIGWPIQCGYEYSVSGSWPLEQTLCMALNLIIIAGSICLVVAGIYYCYRKYKKK